MYPRSEVPLYGGQYRREIWGLSIYAQAKREQLTTLQGLLPETQGHNLAVTALHVAYSLDCEYGTHKTLKAR